METWVCVYTDDAPVEEIKKFDLAVLDADAHPDLLALRDSQTALVGYVSLGEVGEYRWYWNSISDKPWLLDKNPNWDSRMIDVREPEWSSLLLEQIIPRILVQGFDGLFLDTIDNAEYLEKYHPVKTYPGMQKAMVRLIKSIRQAFPDIYIIANRGFSLLDEIGDSINAIVAESLFTEIDFKNKTTRRLTAAEYEPVVRQLKRVQQKHDLKVYSLDYVAGTTRVGQIIEKSRLHGFIPYISTPELDTIYAYTLEGRHEN